MEKIYHYTYLTTNLINGHQYVGDRSCDCDPSKDKYLGSGTLFKKKVTEYGKENFKKEILELFETRKEAFDAQEKYIIEYDTLVPNGYNKSPKGGHGCKDCWSEESKEKCSKTEKGKIIMKETRKKQSEAQKGKKRSKESIEKRVNTRKENGFTLSSQSRTKISKANKGKFLCVDKNGVFYYIDKNDERFKSGELIALSKNKKLLKETKQKISNTLMGRKCSKETKEKMSFAKQHMSKKTIQKMKKPKSKEHKQNISKGLTGRKCSKETRQKISNTLKNKSRNI